MQLARTSVSLRTQKLYRSAWRKWENFFHRYFDSKPPEQYYRTLTYTQFKDQLLMFVSYCVYELHTNVQSIPGIMSALRYSFLTKMVDCSAFDDPFLRAVRQGVASMPAPPHRYDKSHNRHQHYSNLNNAQSHVGDGGILSISSVFTVE